MAEAIARRVGHDILEPASAGICPLGEIPEMTVETLIRNGYSARGLASKAIGREAWEDAEIVVNLTGEPRTAAFEDPGKVEDWDVGDPYGGDAVLYQRIFMQIERQVVRLAERLRQERREGTRPARRPCAPR